MQGHDDWVHSTVWSNDGRVLLTASSDKTCIIWKEIDNLWRDDVRLGIVGGGQAAGFFAAVFSSSLDLKDSGEKLELFEFWSKKKQKKNLKFGF